ncbi:MAG TPA: dTDP-4-dehydrorhamnose 3,5-epimerase [Saprospiraceae bacterium]|nr:dTDP-4-dehydrorhamnose 3,5-epimerase [Saprospiraceae bacterium]
MKIIEVSGSGLFEVYLEPKPDHRGFFLRTYCARMFQEAGLNINWPQSNLSTSTKKGTIRGMHFQYPPNGEIKLIRCVKGSILDTVIDVRKNSSTFLKYFQFELTQENLKMLYIPIGFAHGFQTLEDNCEVNYMVSEFYNINSEGGIRYNDPEINISWPLPCSEISDKDINHQLITDNFIGI